MIYICCNPRKQNQSYREIVRLIYSKKTVGDYFAVAK